MADLCCRGTGAVVAVIGVAVLLAVTSPPLPAWVLVAVPLLLASALPLLRPLERRATEEQRQRAAVAAGVTDAIRPVRPRPGGGTADRS